MSGCLEGFQGCPQGQGKDRMGLGRGRCPAGLRALGWKCRALSTQSALPRCPCGSGGFCWLTVHEKLCPVWAVVLFLFAPAWQPCQLHPRPKSQSLLRGGLALVVSVASSPPGSNASCFKFSQSHPLAQHPESRVAWPLGNVRATSQLVGRGTWGGGGLSPGRWPSPPSQNPAHHSSESSPPPWESTPLLPSPTQPGWKWK